MAVRSVDGLSDADSGGRPQGGRGGLLPAPDLGRVFVQVRSENVLFLSLPEYQDDPWVTQLLVLIMLLCKYF